MGGDVGEGDRVLCGRLADSMTSEGPILLVLPHGPNRHMKQVSSDINVSEMCISPYWRYISCRPSNRLPVSGAHHDE